MKFVKLSAVMAAALALGACAGMTKNEREIQLPDAFANGLKARYIALADWEDDQGDFIDGNWYEDKARLVINGEAVAPTPLEGRELTTEHLNELALARNGLVAVLARGAGQVAPDAAAEAQTKFDCWVEQAEENFQPEHIALCREGFFAAMNEIRFPEPEPVEEVVDVPEPAPIPVEPEMMEPAEFIVFFDFDSEALTHGAKGVVDDVATHIEAMQPTRIVISGHADRSGKNDYNMKLAQKRAVTVAKRLHSFGVPRDMMALQSFGEDAPRVQTTDGTKEAENRFVKILLTK